LHKEGGKEVMKMRFSVIAATLLFSGFLKASEFTSMLRQERDLAQKIKQDYLRGAPYQEHLRALKEIQRQIRAKAHKGKAAKMAEFLTVCVSDLEKTLKQPRSKDNAQLVSDLDKSIGEGCRNLSKFER